MKKFVLMIITCLAIVVSLAACSDPTFTLSVTSSNTEWGTVEGGGTFKEGADVTVSATANDGYVFIGWFNGESKVSDSASYAFAMPKENVSLTGEFESEATATLTVTVTSSNTSHGTVSGGGQFAVGASVTLTATPASGYKFVGWFEGSTSKSTNNPYTFNMGSSSLTLEGRFEVSSVVTEPLTIAEVLDLEVGETVTVKGKVVAFTRPDTMYLQDGENVLPVYESARTTISTFVIGDVVEVTGAVSEYNGAKQVTFASAVKSSGTYTTSAVALAGVDVASVEGKNNKQVSFAGSLFLKQTFVKPEADRDLNIKLVDESNNEIGLFVYRAHANLSAIGDKLLTANGKVISISNAYLGSYQGNYQFLITDASQIVVSEPEQFSLAFSATTGGSITSGDFVSGNEYAERTSVTLTATVDNGYSFLGWFVGEETDPVHTELEYTFVLNSDVTLSAKFAINTYTLTYSSNDVTRGTVSSDLTSGNEYDYDTLVSLTALVVGEDMVFAGWFVGEATTPVSTELNYEFNLVADTVIVGRFIPSTSELVYASNDEALGTVSSDTASGAILTAGTEVTLTATPTENNGLVGWFANDELLSEELIYTFNIEENITIEARFAVNVVVSFVSAEGSVDPVTLATGRKVAQPELTYPDARVEGWYTEAEFTNKHNFDSAVTENLTLYAKWEVVNSIVTGLLVDFEEEGIGYSDMTATLSGKTWLVSQVYNSGADNDARNGEVALRLRDTANVESYIQTDFTLTGVESISFKYGAYSTHTGGVLSVEVSLDGGATWVPVRADIEVPNANNGETRPLYDYVITKEDLRTFGIAETTEFLLKISNKTVKTTNTSINIDDLVISVLSDKLQDLADMLAEVEETTVTTDVVLPEISLPGFVDASWESSDTNYIANDGTLVSRPVNENVTITLTLTVDLCGDVRTVDVDVTVIGQVDVTLRVQDQEDQIIKVDYESTMNVPASPAVLPDGFVFVEWRKDGEDVAFNFGTMITEPVTLVAYLIDSASSSLVSFYDELDQLVDSMYVENGTPVSAIPAPATAQVNYVFSHWTTDKDIKPVYDFSAAVSEALSLYPVYVYRFGDVASAVNANIDTEVVFEGTITFVDEIRNNGGYGVYLQDANDAIYLDQVGLHTNFAEVDLSALLVVGYKIGIVGDRAVRNGGVRVEGVSEIVVISETGDTITPIVNSDGLTETDHAALAEFTGYIVSVPTFSGTNGTVFNLIRLDGSNATVSQAIRVGGFYDLTNAACNVLNTALNDLGLVSGDLVKISARVQFDTNAYLLVTQLSQIEKVDGGTETDRAQLALNELALPSNENSVVTNITLPATGLFGSTVVYTSSDENVIALDGTVTRPSDADVTITIGYTLTLGETTLPAGSIVYTVKMVGGAAEPQTITNPEWALGGNANKTDGTELLAILFGVTADGIISSIKPLKNSSSTSMATNGAEIRFYSHSSTNGNSLVIEMETGVVATNITIGTTGGEWTINGVVYNGNSIVASLEGVTTITIQLTATSHYRLNGISITYLVA